MEIAERASPPRLSRWRSGDTDPVLADGDHRPRFQCHTMSLKHFGHQGNALSRRHVWQANQSGMGRGMHVDERCEVSIECHQNSVFGSRSRQHCRVARVLPEVAGIDDIVALAAQPFPQSAPGTPVDKELQDSATETADKVSLAMTACAYAVHARMSSGSRSG